MEHVVGTGEGDIHVMEDDREAHGFVWDVGKRESRSDVAAAAGIPFGLRTGSYKLYAKVEQEFGDVSTTNFVLEYEIAK
jgi:hypothetical protein